MIKVTFSIDDGDELDRKSMELLDYYGFNNSIFFIPIMSWGFTYIKTYNYYKVGGHTYNHPSDLKLLSDNELNYEIIEAKKILEEKVNYKLEWFCYPRGRYNEKVIEYVKKAGYKYARTTQVGYKNKSLYEITGYHCYQRKEYGGVDWLEYMMKEIPKRTFCRHINIWWHSWEIEKYKEWDKLKKLVIFIKELSI